MTTTARHPMVENYLHRLRAEAAHLPADDARDLVADIEEHLTTALSPGASEAEVRNVLERLGSPTELVAAVAGTDAEPHPRGLVSPMVALWCLVIAELISVIIPVAAVFWVVGLIFTIRATIWTPRQKLAALLVLGSGFVVSFLLVALSLVAFSTCSQVYENGILVEDTCSGNNLSYVVWWTLTLGYLALQGFTIWRLSRSAKRR